MRKIHLLVAVMVALFFTSASFAGDVNPPALSVINKALNAPSGCQAAGDCSGFYATFGIGAQSNAGTPNLIATGLNGAFSDGLDVFVGVGYQLWKGQWLAGIAVTGGYEFTNTGVKRAGGNFVGTEFVKLGYNFFPSAATASPAPSQNPFLNLVSANFLANSTPALIFGGDQRFGRSVAAFGAEIDTVISAGWSSYAQLYNSPSQQGLPSDTTFRIGLQRHF
jgi:hypothetical protein